MTNHFCSFRRGGVIAYQFQGRHHGTEDTNKDKGDFANGFKTKLVTINGFLAGKLEG